MCSMNVSTVWHVVALLKRSHHAALPRDDIMPGHRGIPSAISAMLFPSIQSSGNLFLSAPFFIYNLVGTWMDGVTVVPQKNH